MIYQIKSNQNLFCIMQGQNQAHIALYTCMPFKKFYKLFKKFYYLRGTLIILVAEIETQFKHPSLN